jgi:hypothetical protein
MIGRHWNMIGRHWNIRAFNKGIAFAHKKKVEPSVSGLSSDLIISLVASMIVPHKYILENLFATVAFQDSWVVFP